MKLYLLLSVLSTVAICSCTNNNTKEKYHEIKIPAGYTIQDGDLNENLMIYNAEVGKYPNEKYRLVFSSDYGMSWDSLAIDKNWSVLNVNFIGEKARVQLLGNYDENATPIMCFKKIAYFDFMSKSLTDSIGNSSFVESSFLKFRVRSNVSFEYGKNNQGEILEINSIIKECNFDIYEVIRFVSQTDSFNSLSNGIQYAKLEEFQSSAGKVIPVEIINKESGRAFYLYFTNEFELLVTVELSDEFPENIVYINNSEEMKSQVSAIISNKESFILNVMLPPKQASGLKFTVNSK